jgi:hypothetical protein
MSPITKSHLRRLAATIAIACMVVLPALVGWTPAPIHAAGIMHTASLPR